MHTKGKWTPSRSNAYGATNDGEKTIMDEAQENPIVRVCFRGKAKRSEKYCAVDLERDDNLSLVDACVNGCKVVSEERAKIVGENVAEAFSILRKILRNDGPTDPLILAANLLLRIDGGRP